MKKQYSYQSLFALLMLFCCGLAIQAQECIIRGGVVLNNGTSVTTIDANDHMQVFVDVYLYIDEDCDGVINTGDEQVAATTTNSLGFYTFSVSDADCYVATVNPANLSPGSTFISGDGENAISIDLTDADPGAGGICSDQNFFGYTGGSTTCFGIADGGVDQLIWFNRFSGDYGSVGQTGVPNIEATARDAAGTLFAINQSGSEGFLGTMDLGTGLFNSFGTPIGTGLDADGNDRDFNDVDAMSFDPITGELFGVVRKNLFQIDPVTGMFVPNTFDAPGMDWIEITGSPEDYIDDIAIDFDGNMFAINNNDGASDWLISIDRETGVSTTIGMPMDENGDHITDVEGLSFNQDGSIYATTGDQSQDPTHANKVWEVFIDGNDVLMEPIVCFDNVNTDMEGEECLDGPNVSLTNPDDIGFCFTGDCTTCDIPVTVVVVENCDDSSGTLDVTFTISGGVGPYDVTGTITDDAFEADASTTLEFESAGEATFAVTDAEGCTYGFDYDFADCVKIQECSLAVTTDEDCDSSTGTLDVTFSFTGGTAPYVVTGDINDTFEEGVTTTLEFLSAGDASISVTDANDCTEAFTFDFEDCVKVTECDLDVTASEDCDSSTGTLDVTFSFSGGVAPYVVTGDINDTFEEGVTTTLEFLSAGDASISVTDANDCTEAFTFDFEDCVKVTECNLDVSAVEDCDSSTGTLDVTFSFSGGVAPYVVTGDINDTFEEGITTTLEFLSAGDASISVTDANDCTEAFTFDFEDCVKITDCDLVIGVAESCDEDTGTLDVTLTFNGTDGPYTATGQVEGTFEEGESITVELADAGEIAFNVTNAGNCAIDFTQSFVDCVKTGVECDPFNVTHSTDCDEDSGVQEVTINFAGGAGMYSLDGDISGEFAEGDNFTASFSGAVDINFVITDADGCDEAFNVVYADCVKFTDPCNLTMTADAFCDDSNGLYEIAFTVGGGSGPYDVQGEFISETIDEDSGTFIGLFNGAVNETFTVTDGEGCVEEFDFDFDDCTKACDIAAAATGACSDDGTLTVTLTIGNGLAPYVVTGDLDLTTDGSEEIEFDGAANLSITVTDAQNCTEDYTFNFEDCIAVCDLQIDKTDEDCDTGNGTVDLEFDLDNGTAPYSVSDANATVSGDDIFLTVNGGDSYSFTVTDANDCTVDYSGTAVACEECDIDVTISQDCNTENGILIVDFDVDNGDAPYTLSGDLVGSVNGDFTETFNGGENIDFTVTDSNGCSEDFSFNLTDCEVACQEFNVDITDQDCNEATGENTVSIDFDNGTTPYTLSGDLNGETNGDDFEFVSTSNNDQDYTFTVVDAEGCTGGPFTITVDGCEEVDPTADLRLTKSSNASNVMAGEQFTYTITVTNQGPSDATGIEVTDDLPSCVSYVGSDASQGDYSSGSGIWDLGSLDVGDSETLTITVSASGDAGSCVNVAEITAMDQEDDDSTPGNGVDGEDDQDDAAITIMEMECEAAAGTITGDSPYYCFDEEVSVGAAGFNSDNDFTQAYLLVNEFDIILDFNTDGNFGVLNPGTYCIHPLNFDGGLVFGPGTSIATLLAMDGCFDLNQSCSLVTVTDEVTINVEDVSCDENSGIYTLSFTFFGGLPGVDNTQSYSVNGDVNGTFSAGDTFTADFTSNTPFTVNAEDNLGCSASVTGVRECTKVSVELLTFDGEAQKDGNFIYWATATEDNTDFFTVERSRNGQDFEAIGTVQAAGSSAITLNYNLMDTQAPIGIAYYRLVETTLDGVAKVVSQVIALDRDRDFGIASISPVPVSNVLNMEVASLNNSEIQVTVFDVTGRVVLQTEQAAETGFNQYQLDMTQLLTGTYFIQIVQDNQVSSKKFLKN